jgi:hypothetical protein
VGGRIDAPGAGAEIDAIEIELENVALAEAELEPKRQHELADFARQGALGAEKQVLGQLLGNRRPPLYQAAEAQIGNECACHARQIDAPMLEKAAIFGGNDGVDEMGRQKIDGHVRALPAALGEQAAIARQDAHEWRTLLVAQLDRIGNRGVEGGKRANEEQREGKPEVDGRETREAHLPRQAPEQRWPGGRSAAGALWRWLHSLPCSRPTPQSHGCRQPLTHAPRTGSKPAGLRLGRAP